MSPESGNDQTLVGCANTLFSDTISGNMKSIKKEGKINLNKNQLGIVNEQLIREGIMLNYNGEEQRLASMNKIVFKNVTALRLEMQNIIRISHLEVVPNLQHLSLAINRIEKIGGLHKLVHLKELNLSCNFIEKIEGLENLTLLETLCLYDNQIKKLENLDALENLVIFSIGANKIDTYDGIERLRFLKNLRSFSMEENPISEKCPKSFRTYIASFLPHLTYYQYALVTDQDRAGGEALRPKIRALEEFEMPEVQQREVRIQEMAYAKRYFECFVEHLNEYQLFDSLFESDLEGDALMSIGEGALLLKEQYREEAFSITQRMVQIGATQQLKRQEELLKFQQAMIEARELVQRQGIAEVDEFIEFSEKARQKIFEIETSLETDEDCSMTDEEYTRLENQLYDIKDEFNDKLTNVERELMGPELSLYKAIVEANKKFQYVMEGKVNAFIEEIKSQFVQLREADVNFIDALTEAVQTFLLFSVVNDPSGGSLPMPLKEYLTDRECVKTFAIGMKDLHSDLIDKREDRLIKRVRAWIQEFNDNQKSHEIERNRKKIQEIQHFVRTYGQKFDKISLLKHLA